MCTFCFYILFYEIFGRHNFRSSHYKKKHFQLFLFKTRQLLVWTSTYSSLLYNVIIPVNPGIIYYRQWLDKTEMYKNRKFYFTIKALFHKNTPMKLNPDSGDKLLIGIDPFLPSVSAYWHHNTQILWIRSLRKARTIHCI